ncbi:Galactose-specific lectin nattectin-like [Homarus americanus]|uniref:Galactose-specific lectin nattectin-like n=2 Tax=Homarus americanus TaxID=6706 RepID=A0A8J5JSS3_HOMAM|nr:Galactose-specific lectin nattectin-like [Homarus americanus]
MRVLVAMTAVMACVRVSEPHEMDTVLTKLHENCTGSLVELLLLQQDIRMSQLVDQQKELVNTVSSIAQMLREALPAKQPTRTYPIQCVSPFSRAGKSCLLLALGQRLDWANARQYCVVLGGDLASFHDLTTYVDYVNFINSINTERATADIWIGGRDEDSEGLWLWVTGEPMPKGAPIWGSYDG